MGEANDRTFKITTHERQGRGNTGRDPVAVEMREPVTFVRLIFCKPTSSLVIR